MSGAHRALALASISLLCATGVPRAQQAASQQRPSFKSGVELVTVDFSVVDSKGQAVPDLRADEVVLKIDGQPRTISSLTFLGDNTGDTVSSSESTRGPTSGPAVSDVSSNLQVADGRLVVLVVDVGHIHAGGTFVMKRAVAALLERLRPSDRIALVTIPQGPSVEFTSEHARIDATIGKLTGNYDPKVGSYNIAVMEAYAIENGDTATLGAVIGRECAGDESCGEQVEREARQLASYARRGNEVLFQSLRNLLTALRTVDAPKTMLLVSEGFVMDEEQQRLSDIGTLAARARASIYALRLDVAAFDASERVPVRSVDVSAQKSGVDDLAGATGGVSLAVVGSGTSVFSRVATEIASKYAAAFEPSARDRDGRTHRISVQVKRPRMAVRAGREFRLDAASTGPPAPSSVAEVLRMLLPPRTLPMRISTYLMADVDPGKIRLLVTADVGTDAKNSAELPVGYLLQDRNGVTISSRIGTSTLPLRRESTARAYQMTLSVSPGDYVFRLAALDEQGRAGRVDHPLSASLTALDDVAIADVIVSDASRPNDPVLPVRTIVRSGSAECTADVIVNAPRQPRDVAVTFEIAATPSGPALASGKTAVKTFNEYGRATASATLRLPAVTPGLYVARAVLAAGDRRAEGRPRQFEVVAR
jgi:VWFA-related protein